MSREGLEGAEVLGLDDGRVGEPLLERGEDLDALDRVDAEVGVELHVGLEHLGRDSPSSRPRSSSSIVLHGGRASGLRVGGRSGARPRPLRREEADDVARASGACRGARA